jgi:hypothetical protein
MQREMLIAYLLYDVLQSLIIVKALFWIKLIKSNKVVLFLKVQVLK